MKHIIKGLPYAVLDNGTILLYTQDGHPLHGQIKIRVTEEIGEVSTFIVTGACNIVANQQEMLHEIAKQKPKEKVEYPEWLQAYQLIEAV